MSRLVHHKWKRSHYLLAFALIAGWTVLSSVIPGPTVHSSAYDADGSRWLTKKYESLSEVVPLTNWWRFGDATAGRTMHAALWNGTDWDLRLSNRLTAEVILARLRERKRRAAARILDAGCGWGGSIFYLEDARRAADHAQRARGLVSSRPLLVRYDGLTLSPTQARAANATAIRREIANRAHFFIASFETPLPAVRYAAALAIESIEHSHDLSSSLANLGRALERGGVLVIVTDVLSGPPPSAWRPVTPSDAQLRALDAYRRHWCGPHAAWSPPASEQRWEVLLKRAGLRLVRRTELTSALYQRPRWALSLYFELLRAAYTLAARLGWEWAALQLSNQLGGVARELLLHVRAIEYVFMVAERRGVT